MVFNPLLSKVKVFEFQLLLFKFFAVNAVVPILVVIRGADVVDHFMIDDIGDDIIGKGGAVEQAMDFNQLDRFMVEAEGQTGAVFVEGFAEPGNIELQFRAEICIIEIVVDSLKVINVALAIKLAHIQFVGIIELLEAYLQ